jgi:transposase
MRYLTHRNTTVNMTKTNNKQTIEMVTITDQRRRWWSVSEKAALVRQTYEPGMSVSLVARQHGVAASQLFNWRKLDREGALTAVGAGESVVPASDLAAARRRFPSSSACWARRRWRTRFSRRQSSLLGSESGLRAHPCCPRTASEGGLSGPGCGALACPQSFTARR